MLPPPIVSGNSFLRLSTSPIPAAAKENVPHYCTEHLVLRRLPQCHLYIIPVNTEGKKKCQAVPRAPTPIFSSDSWLFHSLWPQVTNVSHEGLMPDPALPRNTSGSQQPGVPEFPTTPKHLLPLSTPELLLGPVTASGRASKLRAGSGKDLGREGFFGIPSLFLSGSICFRVMLTPQPLPP